MTLPLFFNLISRQVVVQSIGFLAMGVGLASYQVRRRRAIVLVQAISSVLWAVHFYLLGAMTAVVLNTIALARNLLYSQKERYAWLSSPVLPIVFAGAFVAGGVLTYSTWLSLLPTAGMVLASVSLFVSHPQRVRLLSLSTVPFWLVYDASCRSFGGVANDLLTFVSLTVALIRYRKDPHLLK